MKNKKQHLSTSAHTVNTIAVFVIAFLFTACEQQMDKDELKSSIEKANQEWMDAIRNKDASAVAGMYTEDAFILPPNVPAIQGREGIKNFFATALNAGIKDIKLVTEEVDGNETTAIEKGTYEMRVDGDVVVDQGKYLVHWRNVGGKWMFQNDMFNSNMPAMAAPSLQKGNVVGLHVANIKLNRGVSRDQFQEFYQKTVIPEFEKNYADVKLYFIKGIRGENKNGIGLIYFFESDEIRNKYFNADESLTETGQRMQEKMQPAYDQLGKLRETASTKYTDWVVE